MNQIILDTNAYIFHLKGDKKIANELLGATQVCITVISIGELLAGFLKGTKFEYNALLLNKFLTETRVKVLNVGKNTAIVYGKIYHDLELNGSLIPINDVWIASCAIETNSTVITYDKHFLKIPGVKVWKHIVK